MSIEDGTSVFETDLPGARVEGDTTRIEGALVAAAQTDATPVGAMEAMIKAADEMRVPIPSETFAAAIRKVNEGSFRTVDGWQEHAIAGLLDQYTYERGSDMYVPSNPENKDNLLRAFALVNGEEWYAKVMDRIEEQRPKWEKARAERTREDEERAREKARDDERAAGRRSGF